MKTSGCFFKYKYNAVVPERAAPIIRNVGIWVITRTPDQSRLPGNDG